MTGSDQRRRLQQLGLIPSEPAPHPLAINIDPSPFGQIDAIYIHPEVQLDNEPELWNSIWLWRQLGIEHAWTIRELASLSGWEYDVFSTATATKSRLLKWELDGKSKS